MAQLNGSEILAKALKREGVDEMFFLMGGPMLAAEAATIQAITARGSVLRIGLERRGGPWPRTPPWRPEKEHSMTHHDWTLMP